MEKMYTEFSENYDRFVNWASRLAFEMPFIKKQLQGLPEHARILDAACGTGMHTIALAQAGFCTAGADLSEGMIRQARINASTAGIEIPFETAGFGQLAKTFSGQDYHPFDALICLGNSQPHLLTPDDLRDSLADFAACLKPRGMLIIQNRNFDGLAISRERWMEPQSQREADSEWIFLRFYDYLPDGLIDFNIITLQREKDTPWRQTITSTRLRPWSKDELSAVLFETGFHEMQYFGSMSGEPYDSTTSGNLVISAVRR